MANKEKYAIVTMAIGADYIKAMEPGFASKRDYAERWGYDFVLGGEEFWIRDRPIPWSKIPFFLSLLDKYDFIWFSDADSMITNEEIKLEDLVSTCFSNKNREAVWWRDGCGNVNSGQILARGSSSIVRKWLEETAKQTDLLYHGWWENAGMIRVWENDASIREGIDLRTDYRMINAYLFPTEGRESWQLGDFCLHFAGVYESGNIHRYMKYIRRCINLNEPISMQLIINWLRSPPSLKEALSLE
jgi:mannan polymerase II complex MNN10 subunit